jgi:hypothetical protein
MTTTTPSSVRPPSSDEAPKASQTDENAVARWAAFFDSLPADEREGLDELGREIGTRLTRR